jgi:hypothetical protein
MVSWGIAVMFLAPIYGMARAAWDLNGPCEGPQPFDFAVGLLLLACGVAVTFIP